MDYFSEHIKLLNQRLNTEFQAQYPETLYNPIAYFLGFGGKRIRPILTLSAFALFSENYSLIYKPALALELFHNFTLIHDDIMDNASIRRGQPTVHQKYGQNTAILSGDALLIKAYQFFEDLPTNVLNKVLKVFNTTALQVCEGQQLDMDFEKTSEISLAQYLQMIELKTAVLLASSLKIGTLVAEAPQEAAENLYQFGLHLGIAFQIHDDYLDVYGDVQSVGKRQAGDIYNNKKTYLFVRALEKASTSERRELLYWYSQTDHKENKLTQVMTIFDTLELKVDSQQMIKQYYDKAFQFIQHVNPTHQTTENLCLLAEQLMARSH